MKAKNGKLLLEGGHMDYVRFGSGPRTMLLLPGLGDGLRTVKGTALPMAWMYRAFSKDFTVWMPSRREPLAKGATIRDMARDLCEAMDAWGIARADVVGVSMGGMIAQELAIGWPDRVGRLVLVVTAPGSNPILEESVGEWMDQAQHGDHAALMESNLRRLYSADYYRKNKWMVPALGLMTKPKNYDRFLIQARACLGHDTRDRLGRITAPTLVIGGEQDIALGADASRELAAAIPGAVLKMYPKWGHSLYEEAPDFNETVLEFLK